ncbi:antibiotic biosynthesis monooxygenase family protein [Gemmobacter denitrificans]|uniref:Antibiotic biosynthesis monooxygenase n=1 Tax=Gemmobacter denitrificans TaxID=3123040 RepID=A0ABU8BVS7_9RHOB
MIAVIFEVLPAPGAMAVYLDHAARLRAELETVDGFLGVERFQSLTTPGKLLSLSFFRDEEAVRRWRESPDHRSAQEAGRSGLFSDYRLRVAAVIRDYGLEDRAEVP